MRSWLKKEERGWMVWGGEKRGKEEMGRKWEKWHLKYQSRSCKYSFHVLSWFGSISCLFKVFQGFGDSGPGTETGNEKVGEWAEKETEGQSYWGMRRGTGNEPTSNFSSVIGQNAFARQYTTEYRSLVQRSNLAQEHFPMWRQIVSLFEVAFLWTVLIFVCCT